MSKFGSKKKDSFLKSLKLPSLEDDKNNLTIRCKFNFSYFDPSQDAGQNFNEWDHDQLSDLLTKIKNYTINSLEYWQNQRVGGGGRKVLEIYGGFPPKSDFKHPKYVPHQAQWGRFRLGSTTRLVGFTVPTEFHKRPHQKTGEFFDKNTFYVVFLDRDHRFYLT